MAIAFDAAASSAFANTDGSNQRTLSHICGSSSGRGLVVFVRTNDSTDDLSGVTYNGVSMTQALKYQEVHGNNAYVYIYYLANPASGANNIVATFGSLHAVALFSHSYTGVSQSGMLDATGTASSDSTTSLTININTVADNCWVATQFRSYDQTEVAGDGFTTRNIKIDGGISGDNNAPKTPAGTVSEICTLSSNGRFNAIGISIAPSTTIIYTISVSVGSFSITGIDVSLLRPIINMVATVANFVLTGIATTVSLASKIPNGLAKMRSNLQGYNKSMDRNTVDKMRSNSQKYPVGMDDNTIL